MLSIIATTLEVEPASTFTLIYGNRTTASTMFAAELELGACAATGSPSTTCCPATPGAALPGRITPELVDA